jgi:SRSO17 transposase
LDSSAVSVHPPTAIAHDQWDADAVRNDLRAYVVAHLGTPDGVLVADETGFLKKGTKSAGVQRQYSGTAGRTENRQLGVFLAYASAHGHAFLDRELYVPQSWIDDAPRCQEAVIPAETVFATKPALVQRMLARAMAAGVPAAWVLADEVYGDDEPLRRWLEERRQAFVLAVSSTHLLWQDMAQRPPAALVAALPASAWTTISCGAGSKSERLYDWACIALPYQAPTGIQHRLLVRRSRTVTPDLAYFRVLCPLVTSLADLVRVAGMRWTIEECFEEAKECVGLDQYEVRRYDAWYRFITLALVAHAALAVARY